MLVNCLYTTEIIACSISCNKLLVDGASVAVELHNNWVSETSCLLGVTQRKQIRRVNEGTNLHHGIILYIYIPFSSSSCNVLLLIKIYTSTKFPPFLIKSRSRHNTPKYILISLRQVYHSTLVLFEITQSSA